MLLTTAAMVLTACSVSYKLNGASIDYTKTKTIQIADFPIRSSYVWGPMGPMFNNQLKDEYASHTKLIQVKRNGDMKIEGEITQYTQRNKSVAADGRSAQTELSITQLRAGRTGDADGEGPRRTDIQRHRSQLVAGVPCRHVVYPAAR